MDEPRKDGRRKLSDAGVVEAFRLRSTGLSYAAIAGELGVSKSAISNVINRRERAGVVVPPEYLPAGR